ncbi:MAG: phage tail tape measure protein, partial [Rhizobiaceae bacterium]
VMQITDQQVSMLREHILDLGVDPNLKVSAMEAAAAVEMLGRNGLNTSQILEGAARSTILLQNATGSDFAQAADIATDVMALFNIEAGNMETAVDGITSVVNNSKFSITDYQYALAQAGGVASTSGVSFDDLNTSIAAIAPLFSDGSSAGAGLKTMLQRLAAPTGEMKQIMSELGLVTADGTNAFYDAQGNMRSMSDIARALNDRLGGLSEQQRSHALAVLFGSRAVNAAAGLMKYGATVTLTAAEAIEIFGVSQEEANAMIERGITEFDLLQAAMGNTSAAAAAAARMDNLAGSVEILQGVLETLRIRIGDLFKDDIRNAVASVTQFLANNADRIVGFFASVKAFASGIVGVVRAFFGGLRGALGNTLGQVDKNANSWGRNIVISLARGMAAAATAVVRVLQQIGQIITHWLKPGSPPALLPDIDDWGTGAIDAWLGGMTSADFSVFDDIANTVEGYLRNIAPEGDETLVPRIMGSRAVIAEIIDQIRETGQVGEDAFARIVAVAGPLPDSIRAYTEALFDVQAATASVTAAQERLNAIRDFSADTAVSDVLALADTYQGALAAGIRSYASALQNLQAANEQAAAAQAELNSVTSEYDQMLAPLNAELQAIQDQKQAIQDAEKMAELQAILADERLSDAEREAAALDLRELQLRQQIRTTEREKETAVDAAKEKLDAAEAAAEAAKEQAAAQQAAAMALAQAELEAAQAQQAAAQERLDVAKSLIDAQMQQNDLVREQMDLLSQLVDEIGGVGGAIGDALGGADSILGDLGDGFSGLGDGMETAVDDITDSVEDIPSVIDQLVSDIEAEFDPLTQAAEDLGTTWGGVFEGITSRFDDISGRFESAGGRIRGALDRVSGWIEQNRAPVTEFFNETIGETGEKLRDLGGQIVTFVSGQLSKISDWVTENRDLINDFGVVIGKVALALVWFSTEGIQALMDFWQVTGPLLDGVIAQMLNFVKIIMQVVTGDWDGAWQSIKDGFALGWETIKKTFKGFANWVTGWFGTSWNAVVEQWRGNWELLKEIVTLAWANIRGKFYGFLARIIVWVTTKWAEFTNTWRG